MESRPIASIQEEREVYILENGQKRERRDIFVKIFVPFRDKWLHRKQGLDQIELRVWLCLMLHTNADGQCWPSIRKISEETGYDSESEICRAIANLEKHGLIIKEYQGIGKVNKYTMLDHRA